MKTNDFTLNHPIFNAIKYAYEHRDFNINHYQMIDHGDIVYK